MTDYDHITAEHYAAYRPPLHAPILASLLAADERFALGVDVGCGTGQSTHALAKYCDRAIGLEPSDAMLALAKPTDSVTFRHQPGATLDRKRLKLEKADIVTFAGSLFYRDVPDTFSALSQLLKTGGTVLVYDFNVNMASIFTDHGQAILPESEYDHQQNLNDFLSKRFVRQQQVEDELTFTVNAGELVHLLCAVPAWRRRLTRNVSVQSLAGDLHMLASSWMLTARTYATRYELRY